MAKRDNFTATTKALLAKRVAYQCSHPDCPLVTIGPALGSTKSVSTGEAAHITAAAPGGPRYDPSLTPEERKAFANGIWMCGVHAKQVDSDAEHFTVETLREWKRNAERKAFDELSTGRRAAHTIVKIEIEDDLLARLGFSQADDVDALADRMAPLAKDDLAGFMLEPGWPAHAAQLSFYVIGGSPEAFGLADCAAMLSTVGSVTIVSPPGTGKSTSLIQLCGDILRGGQSIAIHVPLSEWSTQSESLFGSVTHRSAYKSASPPIVERDLVLLALHGRLIIALDGWNELDSDSRKRATNEIRRLQREFPLLEIVVSTRKQALDVPLPGPSLGILPLSENQQLDIARSMAGDAGEKLVDHAWRVPGLRELVSVPLYLHVLLARTPDGTMPTTKEEVLRLFIEEHERTSAKRFSIA